MTKTEMRKEMECAVNFQPQSIWAAGLQLSLAQNQVEQSSKLVLNKTSKQLVKYSTDMFIRAAISLHARTIKQPLKN